MKKILIMALLLVSGMAVAQEVTDKLTIADFEIKAGGTTTVDVLMTQHDAQYTSLQFYLYLPEGVTIAKKENGKYNIIKGEMCAESHSISSNFKNGRYIVTIGSPDKDLFIGEEGIVLQLPLEAGDMVSTGNQDGFLRSIKLVKLTATSNNTDEVPFNVTPYVEAKIAASGYGSFSWPRALDFTNCDDVEKVMVGGEYADKHLSLTEVETKQVAAETGIIIKGTPGTAVRPLTLDSDPAADKGTLTPTCGGAYKVTTDNSVYVLKTGKNGTGFYPCLKDVVIPQYKAYLPVDGSQDANMLSIMEEEATGIDGVSVDVFGNESLYSITGARVNRPVQKGVYVSKGNKIVIK